MVVFYALPWFDRHWCDDRAAVSVCVYGGENEKRVGEREVCARARACVCVCVCVVARRTGTRREEKRREEKRRREEKKEEKKEGGKEKKEKKRREEEEEERERETMQCTIQTGA